MTLKHVSAITLLLTATMIGSNELAFGQCTVDQLHGPGTSLSFGSALSVADGRVLVGSIYDSQAAQFAGAAYVYGLTANGFSYETLLPLHPVYDGRFGQSVAMVGDQALVGALDSEFGAGAGAVFVHERTSGGWRVMQKLTASDAHAGGNFGVAMEASGERIVIGASGDGADRGTVYVFEKDHDVWTEVAVVRPTSSHGYMSFGAALDIDGSRMVVGSYGANVFPIPPGAAYVFEESGGAWSQTQRLQPSGLDSVDLYAAAVGIRGDRIVVGAPGENLFSSHVGAAYVYEFFQDAWSQVSRLTGSPAARSGFGHSIAMDGERLAIGAGPSWLNPSVTKYVETFRGADSSWTSEGYEIGDGPGFGACVELWNGAVLVGGDTDLGVDSVRVVNVAREAQLFGSDGEVSLSEQGDQQLLLTTCSQLGGAPYRILGSLAGAGGFTVGGANVPFGIDRYTRQTLLQPGLTMVGATGVLDAAGHAAAIIRMQGPAQSVFVGRTLHHAALIYGGGGMPQIATNAVSVPVVP